MFKIITVGRQFGSGGRQIAKAVAAKLGYAFYDKELIAAAAKVGGIDEKLLAESDESIKGRFFQSFSLGLHNTGNTFAEMADISLSDRIFLIQSKIIKEIAAQGNAVIVGRCADYVLAEHPYCYRVFIYADIENRLERAATYYGMERENLKDTISKLDKRRASYYNYYSGKKWGRIENYHLALNSGKITAEKCVNIIAKMVEEA